MVVWGSRLRWLLLTAAYQSILAVWSRDKVSLIPISQITWQTCVMGVQLLSVVEKSPGLLRSLLHMKHMLLHRGLGTLHHSQVVQLLQDLPHLQFILHITYHNYDIVVVKTVIWCCVCEEGNALLPSCTTDTVLFRAWVRRLIRLWSFTSHISMLIEIIIVCVCELCHRTTELRPIALYVCVTCSLPFLMCKHWHSCQPHPLSLYSTFPCRGGCGFP